MAEVRFLAFDLRANPIFLHGFAEFAIIFEMFATLHGSPR